MITPEESEAGLKAYEQVQAFASLRQQRMGLVYILLTLILLIMAVASYEAKIRMTAAAWIGIAFVSGGGAWWNWQHLNAQDAKNRALLAELHAKYGDDLPWLEVERQMAEIRRIQAEQEPR